MVVVDPDEISVLDVNCNLLGEEPIGFLVGIERCLIEGDLTRVVVKQEATLSNLYFGQLGLSVYGNGVGDILENPL